MSVFLDGDFRWFFVGMAGVVTILVILLAHNAYPTYLNDVNGYSILYQGDQHVTVRVYNEKGHAHVDELLRDGWKISGNPEQVNRGSFMDFTLVRE